MTIGTFRARASSTAASQVGAQRRPSFSLSLPAKARGRRQRTAASARVISAITLPPGALIGHGARGRRGPVSFRSGGGIMRTPFLIAVLLVGAFAEEPKAVEAT